MNVPDKNAEGDHSRECAHTESQELLPEQAFGTAPPDACLGQTARLRVSKGTISQALQLASTVELRP